MRLTAPLLSWKRACIFLLVTAVLQFCLILSKTYEAPRAPRLFTRPPKAPYVHSQRPLSSFFTSWSYTADRDARNPGLSLAQCDEAFPNLFYEIDRAVSFWQDRNHTVTQEDIDISWRQDAAFKVLIHDNQLRILETKNTWQNKGYRMRTLYVLSQLQRALLGAVAAGEPVPDAEFAVTVDDISLIPNPRNDTHSIWAFTRRIIDGDQDRVWLIPDPDFYAAPPVASSYMEMQRRARLHDAPLAHKIPKLVWRGVVWTNRAVRGRLMNVTHEKGWADVQEVDWNTESNIMRLDDFCAYRFTIHTEGRSWSGRLKYLLNCDSLLFMHRLDWTTAYYHLLVPDGSRQNYIPVSRDFRNLEAEVTYYIKHPKEAQRIADNAVATFRDRYISPAAEACYWRRLVHGWNRVAFTPQPFENTTVNFLGATVQEEHLRGIPYEEFL